jgi:hypothetical protein
MFGFHVGDVTSTIVYTTLRAMFVINLTLHIINVEKNVFVFFFIFLFLICVYIPWVCFDVLFFISEFHVLFLLIFILFWLACIYLCCWCFPLGVYFNVCLFAYLFPLYSLFVFIYCLCCVTVLYHFFFERKRDYHILFVY